MYIVVIVALWCTYLLFDPISYHYLYLSSHRYSRYNNWTEGVATQTNSCNPTFPQ